MPSLREMIEKQKAKEKANGQNVQNSQPTPAQTSSQTPQVALGENGTISKQEVGGNLNGNGSNGGQEKPAVLPEGLTGLAKLKWLRENAQLANNATTNLPKIGEKIVTSNVEKQGNSVSANTITDKLLSETATGNEIVAASASKTADDAKTNDGVIDTESLRNNLTYLANNIEQKEIVAQIVRTIATQLKNSPELTPYMANADVDLVIRGLRMAYQIQARKKSEDRDKKQSKVKGNKELMDAFADAGLSGLSLNLK